MNKVFSIIKKLKDPRYLLKIISIFLSLFLWFFVLKSQPVSIEENLNIQFLLPEGYTFSKKPISNINVYLEGLRATLRRSDIEKSKVRIKVPPLVGDSFSYVAEIPVNNIPQPPGVKIKDFHPKKIKLSLEKSISKKVPVEINFKGSLSPSFYINSKKVSPEYVLITGATSILNTIDSIKTIPIDLSKLDLEENERKIDLEIPPLVVVEELHEKIVSVRIGVDSFSANTTEIELPIKFITNGSQMVRPSKKTVSIKLNYIKSEFSKLSSNNDFGVSVFADLTNSDNLSNKKIQLKIDKPKNVKIIKLKPDYITIE